MATVRNALKSDAVSPWPKLSERRRLRTLKGEAVLHAAVQSFNRKGGKSTSFDEVAVALNWIGHWLDPDGEVSAIDVARGARHRQKME